MQKKFRTLGTLATTLLLASLGLVAIDAPAYADATCSGDFCVGYDPGTTYSGCTASTTRQAVNAIYQGVQLATAWNVYSYTCNANWARGQLTGVAVSRGYKMQVQIGTVAPGGYWESTCFPGISNTGQTVENCGGGLYAGSAAAYTDMVNGTDLTYATVSVFDVNGNLLTRANVNL